MNELKITQEQMDEFIKDSDASIVLMMKDVEVAQQVITHVSGTGEDVLRLISGVIKTMAKDNGGNYESILEFIKYAIEHDE